MEEPISFPLIVFLSLSNESPKTLDLCQDFEISYQSQSHWRYVRRLPPPGFPPLVEGSLKSELLENQETGGVT